MPESDGVIAEEAEMEVVGPLKVTGEVFSDGETSEGDGIPVAKMGIGRIGPPEGGGVDPELLPVPFWIEPPGSCESLVGGFRIAGRVDVEEPETYLITDLDGVPNKIFVAPEKGDSKLPSRLRTPGNDTSLFDLDKDIADEVPQEDRFTVMDDPPRILREEETPVHGRKAEVLDRQARISSPRRRQVESNSEAVGSFAS